VEGEAIYYIVNDKVWSYLYSIYGGQDIPRISYLGQ